MAQAVKDEMKRVAKDFPSGMSCAIPYYLLLTGQEQHDWFCDRVNWDIDSILRGYQLLSALTVRLSYFVLAAFVASLGLTG